MDRVILSGVQRVWRAGLARAWRHFERAAEDPERAQGERLRALLRANAASAYGVHHGFARIASLREWRQHVPIVDYDALEPWIERVVRGERAVLTAEPVRMLERSGGSSAANKLLPYTDGLLAEYTAAINAWLHDLHRAQPRLHGTRSYWSVSPVTRQRELTAGGLPIGFEDDTQYFGPLTRWALRRMLAVPPALARMVDLEEWRRETARRLLATRDLGFISIWAPSFLTLLMEAIERELPQLLRELAPRRRAELERALDGQGHLCGELLWPRLALISCWADGPAAELLPELRRWFPHTPIQGKGLLATEGVVSFPLCGHEGAVLAVASHVLEWLDLDHPEREPLLPHELRDGGLYSPVLSTAGGLYRYHLQDVVRCVGHFRRAPLVRFEGKLDAVSDLCGEKLHARLVDRALLAGARAAGLAFEFAMLAPQPGTPPAYRLFVETSAPDDVVRRAAAAIERELRVGQHYEYCRVLGQLGELRAVRVRDGWATYERTLVQRGARAGDIKPTHLHTDGRWSEIFEVCS